MNTSALKNFAQSARTQLLAQVEVQLDRALSATGALAQEFAAPIKSLNDEISRHGRAHVVEEAAYLWFNRFVALRFMDVNDYADLRAVSPATPADALPELLQLAKAGQLPDDLKVNRARLNDLLDGRLPSTKPEAEVYRILLRAECNRRHAQLPFLFERITDYSELLLPADLLSKQSILHQLRETLTEETCKDNEEVIGWLYQFYISEKKDAVFAAKGKVKKEDIPAVTQLFTPRWIVEYMVQNTLGKLWLQSHPDSSLRDHMPYYLESPAPDERSEHPPAAALPTTHYPLPANPQDLTLADQACGSGHILLYAFELLTRIYEESGYAKSEIPALILAHNLTGFEIDVRAAQLAAFTLMMRARRYHRSSLRRGLAPNIVRFQDLPLSPEQSAQTLTDQGITASKELRHDLTLLQQATNFGSLITPTASPGEIMRARTQVQSKLEESSDLFAANALRQLEVALHQLAELSRTFWCVVDNPPYMGSGNMNPVLSKYVKKEYPNSKSDLFSSFMERGLRAVSENGYVGMITMQSWMFLSSVAQGSSGGVGAKWTWTTNESIFSFTGSTCPSDICFLKTSGPDLLASTCTDGCTDDGVTLTVSKGSTSGEAVLDWSGGTSSYTVLRSGGAADIRGPANEQITTDLFQYIDGTSGTDTSYYLVRASTCLTLKACESDDDCNTGEGTCVSLGPFQVPGRSLTATDITVSSSSLTSSLVTFFSPPTEVFSVTSAAQPGGAIEILTNNSADSIDAEADEFPPGCCPEDPEVPRQLRCGENCVDYLNDPLNCGACGNVCGEEECCTNGNCVSLCPDDWILCDGQCVDPENDSTNCGTCGTACATNTCCDGGACASFCDPGYDWCGNGLCADLDDDSLNCGWCGNMCELDECCNGGSCVSLCEEGRELCEDGLCYDTQNDPNNCGWCGNSCGDQAICDAGVCVPCDGHAGAQYACDNRCVNLNTDPFNCGECGNSCNIDCPSDFTGVCSSGNSCHCVGGTPAEPPPSNIPPPTDPFCPNLDPSPSPVAGGCPNPSPTSPIAPVCPSPGPPAPPVGEAPICQAAAVDETIPPFGFRRVCRPAGLLFKEIPAVVTVCGESIPGPDGTCGEGVSNVAAGTFMRLVPDTETEVGLAFLTPFGVHVASDTSNDGLIGPGETVSLFIEVLNAGPVEIEDAVATIVADPVDLTDDGVSNAVAMVVVNGTSSYGTIAGTQPSVECEAITLQPATNLVQFELTVPEDHPGDTSHPLILHFTGTVDGNPFGMDMPINLGVVDRCVIEAATGDYDGLDGLLPPMARLVPEGDTIPFPTKALNAGKTAPLKMRQFCGGEDLHGADVTPPEIVGLSEETLGPLNILSLNLNDESDPDDLFFRWKATTKQWIFNMRTTELEVGTFTLKIRVAGRKDYITGFEIR